MSESKPISSASSEELQGEDVLDLNANVTARLRNPLHGIPRDQLTRDVEAFAKEKELTEHRDILVKGAVLAQNPEEYETLDVLDDEERRAIAHERAHKWSHPTVLYDNLAPSRLHVVDCSDL